ncbi:MAG: twin-arginine translocation signal domain-containing protein [Proteobacteria bacterium]|nr:twin-arginine translocation signal domain-containing protein [Pseudomonadota bacterium]
MTNDHHEVELSWLGRQLTGGRISRRDFMGRAAALGVTAALASTLASTALKAAAPKMGGHLRTGRGHGSTTDSLDPATYENAWISGVNYFLHNHLAEIGKDGKLTPELAESWEASADAATWRFKIRKGVEFHNGKTLDAEDVVASINHHRGEDTKSAAKPLVKPITDIKAEGKDTVVITLEGGSADFPFIISDYHLAILPAKDGVIDWQSGGGTGGYVLESFEPGVRASFKRNPNYWKENAAYFDSSELLSIGDVAARTNALSTNEIDVMDRVDIKTLHLLKRNQNIRIDETTGYAHYTFAMRTDTPPFDDNNVRMALKLSLDRDALLQNVLRGHGSVGNDHPISVANRYHAADLPQRVYDVDKAKWHLKQAGLSSLTVDLSTADAAFAGAVDAAVLYKEHAAKAGITINVVREPNDGYWSAVWMKKPWSAVYWGGRPTEDNMFSTAYAAGADWNDTFWSHDRFNKLLVEARAELNEAKRREMYVEMQGIVSNEGGVVVPMFNNYVFAMSTKVQHGQMSGSGDLDGDKWMERWWFA